MQNVVPRLSNTPGRIRHAGPAKGSGNTRVYRDILGLDEEEMKELHVAGII
jgi:formyl-CoA transferase